MEVGDTLPDIEVTLPDGTLRKLGDVADGRALVVYFYPRDDTSGCTREAQAFTAMLPEFAETGVGVIGISKDSPADHQKFAAKHDLTVPLATDADGAVCEAFGVWVEKNMYGKKHMGIERATFLFDAKGVAQRVWRKVKVPGHVEQVLAAARAL
ncbi:peroxiredoxin [Sphingomonas baiyangensis]|uniref:thioredoxin-dependent peroxiredoxin n=1 Tax=Sphingomonas baiyangensis TaxID=2572576 RepID=A0A4U1L5M8_9SPHN|nr:peroxiredoxin [Sphingomonas baiyangensis]